MKYYQKVMCSEQVAVEWVHPGQPVLQYLLWPEVLTHLPERGLCPVATAYHCFPADAQDFHCSSAPDMRCSFRILRGHLTQEGTALAEGNVFSYMVDRLFPGSIRGYSGALFVIRLRHHGHFLFDCIRGR